jgi:hypothetical protein
MPMIVRQLMILLVVVACTGRTPTPEDPADSEDTDVDTDVGECPGALDQEEFIAEVLPKTCGWFVTCPDSSHRSVEDCVRAFERLFRSSPCWDACAAADWAGWIAAPPGCTNGAMDTLPACNEVKTCPD